MTVTSVGLLHPGEMGAALGADLTRLGHQVVWCTAGRGPATRRRADESGLVAVETLAELVAAVDVVLSVCPPHAAAQLAVEVAAAAAAVPDLGQRVYVDANAVAPATSERIGSVVSAAGLTFVDGGVIGPPPLRAGRTRLYLSGAEAAEVAALFAGGFTEARVLGGKATAASALKMAYAAWTKGSAALLLTARALARAGGVEDALHDEWALSLPDLEARWQLAEAEARAKGWRWTGEMEQIAASMAAAGLPEGFHRAAAEVFGRYA